MAPDQGRVGWALEVRERLGNHTDLALIAKQRPTADKAYAVEMVGNVKGKTALLIDDMIMTGGTLVAAAEMLLDRGARSVYACATHAAFAPGTRDLLENSPFTQVLLSDTVPLAPHGNVREQQDRGDKCGSTIRRCHLAHPRRPLGERALPIVARRRNQLLVVHERLANTAY